MDKNTEIKFVGQPVFGQILKLIDKADFNPDYAIEKRA